MRSRASRRSGALAEIRPARFEEFGAAAALRAEMANEMNAGWDRVNPRWRDDFMRYFSGRQAAGTSCLYLALDGERPVGMAAVSIHDDYRRHVLGQTVAYINAVYVQPPYRRRGIASQLVERAVAWAREHGCTRVRLRSSDAGRSVYERLGFRTGREMERDL